MKRPWQVWTAFGLGLVLVLGVMGWFTWTVANLDAERRAMRQQALAEDKIRLAMWRMESLLAPVIGTEAARPYFVYNAFYPAGRAYTRMFARLQPGEVLFPSPVLRVPGHYVRLHFQMGPDGRLSSPQVPEGNMRDLAESGYLDPNDIAQAGRRLESLASLLSGRDLSDQLPAAASTPAVATRLPSEGEPGQGPPSPQQLLKNNDWNARNAAFQQAATVSNEANPSSDDRQEVQGGLMKPFWIGDDLVLARRVEVGGQTWLQGVWLDWPTIREDLTAQVADLLPDVVLEPLHDSLPDSPQRRLASLPVRLLPGNISMDDNNGVSPMKMSLLIAWVAALLAALCVALVLRSALALSERRAAFVSAVTHELRTPLTTFRMYTELLDAGMVTQPAKLQEYYSTLHVEADRLGHLVENVLAYARLERNRFGTAMENVPVQDLLDRVTEPLERRALQTGADWQTELSTSAATSRVLADVAAVERILFNLVDNACKYGCSRPGDPITLQVTNEDGCVAFKVCDLGPGIPAGHRRKLFLPFRKAPAAPPNASEGIGLGLALCRKLAHKMRGNLIMEDLDGPGACFILRLPTARH